MEKKKKHSASSHFIEMSIPLASDLSSIQKRDFIFGLLFVLEDFYGSYSLGTAMHCFLESKISRK